MPQLKTIIFLFAFFVLLRAEVYSQNCSIKCIESFSISFDGQCNIALEAKDLIRDASPCEFDQIFEITILDENGDTISSSPLISCDYAGQRLIAQVNESAFDNFCWTYIEVDHKEEIPEVCDNGSDDDCDGLVDIFDPDCLCNDLAYQAQCPLECNYLPDSFPSYQMKTKWVSDDFRLPNIELNPPNIVSGDIDGDGTIEILTFKSFVSDFGIVVLNSLTGDIEHEFNTSLPRGNNYLLSIADIDSDGFSEILVSLHTNLTSTYVQCYSHLGNLIWTSEDLLPYFDGIFAATSVLNIADFNGDGVAEVYMGHVVLNAENGATLAVGRNGKGCNQYNAIGCSDLITVAADVLPSAGLELVAGNTVYQVDLNNLADSTGNSMIPVANLSTIPDGFSAVADIDGDQELDIISVSTNPTGMEPYGIVVWNPRTGDIIASAESGIGGSIPFIGDVDGDCIPEIGVVFNHELRMYDYDATDQLNLKYSRETSDGSGLTGITMFDFNQDGMQELIYRDQDWLRIYDGVLGMALDSLNIQSETNVEYPIVVDVDSDGQAEVLVSGYNTEIYCIESGGLPWAPARSVWNQMCYNVTNINDDLTVPRHPQNPAVIVSGTDNCLQETCPQVYNNFLVQATYRTQEGCVQWAASDLVLDVLESVCHEDSLLLVINVSNIAALPIYEDCIYMSYYTSTNEIAQDTILWCPPKDAVADTLLLPSGINYSVKIPAQGQMVYLVINDPGTGANANNYEVTQIVECNYANNIDSIFINSIDYNLNLADTLFICNTDSVVINAGSSFTSYVWNDGTTDSLITASEPGVYSVTTTDYCDNTYIDSTQVLFYSGQDINIDGPNSLCLGDSVTMSVENEFYTNILWRPSSIVSCDTCFVTKVSIDSSMYLTAILINQNCESSDSVFIEIDSPVNYNYQVDLCEGDSIWFFDRYVSIEDTYNYESPLCDTVYNMELRVLPHTFNEISETICFGDSIWFADTYLSVAGEYFDTLSSSNACDSIVKLNLLTIEVPITHLDTVFCSNDSIIIDGVVLADAGLYTIPYQSVEDCDSLIMIEVSHFPSYDVNIQEYICEGDSILLGSNYLSTSGLFQVELKSVYGCDSIVNLDLSVVETVQDTIKAHVCEGDSISLYDQWYKSAGTYEVSFNSSDACDSLITIFIEELPSFGESIVEFICEHDTLWFDNIAYTDAGVYQIDLIAANGCDSIIELSLNHLPSYQIEQEYSFCENDSIFIIDQFYSDEGSYEVLLSTTNGCDSLVNITVTERPILITNDQITLCKGDSTKIFNEWVSTPGIYSDTLLSVMNCDSISNIDLIVEELFFDSLNYSICIGDSILIDGEYYHGSQTFETIRMSDNSCDTLLQHTIVIREHSEVWIDTSFCPGDSILLDDYITTPGLYTINYINSDGCDSIINYEVEYYYEPFELELNNISLDLGMDTTISVQVDTAVWDILWSPDNLVDCVTCSAITIIGDQNSEINLTLTHSDGCIVFDSFMLNIHYDEAPVIPNIFSPNQDGFNDVWSVDLSSFTGAILYIYDRWGNLIKYEANVPVLSWDGYFKGEKAEQGVYVYVVKYTDLRGSQIIIPGDVTLIR